MVDREAGGRSVDPGWRSGRSPATRERLRSCKVPHYVPLCNTEPAFRPTAFFGSVSHVRKAAGLQAIPRWDGFVQPAPLPAGGAATGTSARRIAAPGARFASPGDDV